jgi:MoaA/NifB/PqqE/SkfB family radical SAM enzyme
MVYTLHMIVPKLLWRFVTQVNCLVLWRAAIRCGLGNLIALRRFQRRLKKGVVFPPFLFISMTNRCNLRCTGCWVATDAPPADLSMEDLGRLIEAGRSRGARFFGLLGGEPMLHPHLWDLLETYDDCYFQLFTNGTLLTEDDAKRMRKLRNVTPVISIEGNPAESDRRRKGSDVFDRSISAVDSCCKQKLLTGVATSLCATNIDHFLTESYLDEMIRRHVQYVWFYIYRPVGADPSPDLALTEEQIIRARRFIVEMRAKKPILIIDSYWDAKGQAVCPAVTGISHHISPWGAIEPCPVIQFAAETIHDGDIAETIENSEFLASFRRLIPQATRGCVLMDDPKLLRELVELCGAKDSSGRNVGMAELEAMLPVPGHHQAGEEIPEKHWVYRFAKKHWFFGFGAYG